MHDIYVVLGFTWGGFFGRALARVVVCLVIWLGLE